MHATVVSHDATNATFQVEAVDDIQRIEGGAPVSPPAAGDQIAVSFPDEAGVLLADGRRFLVRIFRGSGGGQWGSTAKDRLTPTGDNCPGEVPAGVRNLDGSAIEQPAARAVRQATTELAGAPTGQAAPWLYAIGVTVVGFTVANIVIVRRRRKGRDVSARDG